MEEDKIILANNKIHGRGRVQIPKEVRKILKLEDGDKVYFIQDSMERISIEKVPSLKRAEKSKSKYTVTQKP